VTLVKSAQPKHTLTDEQMLDLADKCFEFCKQASGVTLYPYQENFGLRVIQSILFEDGEEITALFSRQSGKTETVSCVITGLCVILPSLARMPDLATDDRINKFKTGFWVGIFAPSYELAGIMHARMSSRMQSEAMQAVLSDPDIGIDLQGGRKVLRLPNGSYVDANSAGPQANIEGKTYHVIICEECQDISNYKIKKCLAHDTEIYTLNGKVKISELNGEPIPQVTKDGRLNVVYNYEYHDNGLQDVWRITTAGGYHLDATENHRWLTRTRGIKGLNVKTTSALTVNDTVPLPATWQVQRTGSSSYDKGLVLGAMLGDGSFRGTTPVLCGTREFLRAVSDASLNEWGVGYKEYSYNERSGLSEGALTDHNYKSNPVMDWIKEIGLKGVIGVEKRLPSGMMLESEEFMKGLICGLYETDGSIVGGQKPHISFDNTSIGLIQDVRDILLQFGISTSLSSRENNKGLFKNAKRIYSLRVKRKRDVALFKSTFPLLTKNERLQSIDCSISHDGHGKGAGVPENMRFARITSIKYLGKKPTYCLTLENETFIANGMLSLNSIHPMLASTNGTIVKIGTPNAQKGDFFDACERNRARTATSGKLATHFQYDYEYPARYNPRYRRYIEKEIERLGYDSDEFRMSYRLHWLLERGHFIPPEIFDSCGVTERDKLRVKKKGEYIHFKRPSSPYGNDTTSENMVASLDIGRANDSTVMTVAKVWWENPQNFAGEDRYHSHIVNWLEIEGDDHETQYPQILDFLEKYNIGILIVDATGRGDPIYDRLSADLYDKGVRVIPFIFSQRSKHEGYTILYQELKEQRLTYPAGDHARTQRKWQRFVKQMYDLQKEWKGKYMDVKAPTSGKKGGSNSDGHDDYPDSLMMLCYAINRKLIAAEVGVNPFVGSRAVANARRLAGARIGEGANRGRRKFDGW